MSEFNEDDSVVVIDGNNKFNLRDALYAASMCLLIGLTAGLTIGYYALGGNDPAKLGLEWTYLDTSNRLHTYVKPPGFMNWVEVDQHSGVSTIGDQ